MSTELPLAPTPPKLPTLTRTGELPPPPSLRLRPSLVQLESPLPPATRKVSAFESEPGCEGERVIDLPVSPAVYPEDVLLVDHQDRGTRQVTLEAILDYTTPVIAAALERKTLSFSLTADGWMARFEGNTPKTVTITFSDGAEEWHVMAPVRRVGPEYFVFISSTVTLPTFVYADTIR